MSKLNGTSQAGFWLPVFIVLSLLITIPVQAATIAEIVAMSEAGVPPDVIIDVIDATGMEDPLDADSISWLLDSNVDNAVLEYVLVNYYIEDDIDIDDVMLESSSERDYTDNWAGGGFHGSTGYNPLNDQGGRTGYWDGPGGSSVYHDDHYTNYGGIYIYEPPVYVLDNDPYYRAWRVPRNYYYNRGYWDGTGYITYDNDYHEPYYYNNNRGYDPYWNDWYENGRMYDGRWRYHDGWSGGFFGNWHNNGRRHRYNFGGDAWYHSDGLNLRISF